MALVMPYLADDQDSMGVVFACLLLVMVVAGGLYLVVWLRRRYWGGGNDEVPMVGFTLGDLRHLLKTGQLSQEEFDRAKEKIVAAAQRAAQRDTAAGNSPSSTPPGRGQ